MKDLWNDYEWVRDETSLDDYALKDGESYCFIRLAEIFPPTDEDVENDKFPLDYLLDLKIEERNEVIRKNIMPLCKADYDRILRDHKNAMRR